MRVGVANYLNFKPCPAFISYNTLTKQNQNIQYIFKYIYVKHVTSYNLREHFQHEISFVTFLL